jgi:hypothetical protein
MDAPKKPRGTPHCPSPADKDIPSPVFCSSRKALLPSPFSFHARSRLLLHVPSPIIPPSLSRCCSPSMAQAAIYSGPCRPSGSQIRLREEQDRTRDRDLRSSVRGRHEGFVQHHARDPDLAFRCSFVRARFVVALSAVRFSVLVSHFFDVPYHFHPILSRNHRLFRPSHSKWED